MATDLSNHYLAEKNRGNIDLDGDTLKAILMDTGFTFDIDTHGTYADLSASELATGNGYTQNTKTLTTASVSVDHINDRSDATYDDVTWTASGGAIGPSAGMIVFDDTTVDDTVIGYIDFGSDQTAGDGAPFTVANIIIRSSN